MTTTTETGSCFFYHVFNFRLNFLQCDPIAVIQTIYRVPIVYRAGSQSRDRCHMACKDVVVVLEYLGNLSFDVNVTCDAIRICLIPRKCMQLSCLRINNTPRLKNTVANSPEGVQMTNDEGDSLRLFSVFLSRVVPPSPERSHNLDSTRAWVNCRSSELSGVSNISRNHARGSAGTAISLLRDPLARFRQLL